MDLIFIAMIKLENFVHQRLLLRSTVTVVFEGLSVTVMPCHWYLMPPRSCYKAWMTRMPFHWYLFKAWMQNCRCNNQADKQLTKNRKLISPTIVIEKDSSVSSYSERGQWSFDATHPWTWVEIDCSRLLTYLTIIQRTLPWTWRSLCIMKKDLVKQQELEEEMGLFFHTTSFQDGVLLHSICCSNINYQHACWKREGLLFFVWLTNQSTLRSPIIVAMK